MRRWRSITLCGSPPGRGGSPEPPGPLQVGDSSPDENQNARRQRENSHHYCRDGDVDEHGDSSKDEIDREKKHAEVLGDIHASFLRQTRRVCTLKNHDPVGARAKPVG
jgi:hypothetical protein